MQAYPSFDGTLACVRIVPFHPFADLAGMARKRTTMLAELSAERSKPRPNELLVKAYEIWLRVYNRNVILALDAQVGSKRDDD